MGNPGLVAVMFATFHEEPVVAKVEGVVIDIGQGLVNPRVLPRYGKPMIVVVVIVIVIIVIVIMPIPIVPVVGAAVLDVVISRSAVQVVLIAPAEQPIVPVSTTEGVPTFAAEQQIVSVTPFEQIGSPLPE